MSYSPYDVRTYSVKAQGMPFCFKFRGSEFSVQNFCQGLAAVCAREVTYTYETRRRKYVGGTGINLLSVREP